MLINMGTITPVTWPHFQRMLANFAMPTTSLQVAKAELVAFAPVPEEREQLIVAGDRGNTPAHARFPCCN